MPQRTYENMDVRPRLLGSLADSSFGDVVSAINSDPGAAQVDTITITNYVLGKVLTWTIDDVPFSYTMTAADVNVTGVAASIRDQMQADPIFGGLFYATSLLGVITLTARVPGYGWTLVSTGTWVADFTVANVTANASAAAVPFGRLVVSDGQITGGAEMQAKLASAANLTARAVTLTPVGVAGATYNASVTVDDASGVERTYSASFVDEDPASLLVGAADAQINFESRIPGAAGEDLSVEILAAVGNNDPLTATVIDGAIVVTPSTDDAGAIACTAAEVIEAIQAGTPRIVTNTIAANNAVQWENLAGVPLNIQITAAAGAGVSVDSTNGGANDGQILIVFDAAVGPATTAAAMIAAVNGDADASRLVHLQNAGASTGAGNVAVLGATPLGPVPSMIEVDGLVSVAATGTGLDDVAAVAAANLARTAPAAATVNAALAAQLNAALPAQTVAAVGAATLALTAELAGKNFDFAVGSDNVAATWTISSDNVAEAVDVREAMLGVTLRTDSVEINSSTEPGYVANSAMNVLRSGTVIVLVDGTITPALPVFVRLADTGLTGDPLGSFSCTAGTDLVRLARSRARWVRSLSPTRAILRINAD